MRAKRRETINKFYCLKSKQTEQRRSSPNTIKRPPQMGSIFNIHPPPFTRTKENNYYDCVVCQPTRNNVRIEYPGRVRRSRRNGRARISVATKFLFGTKQQIPGHSLTNEIHSFAFLSQSNNDGSSMCLELALEGERLCKSGDCRAGVAFFQVSSNSAIKSS